MVQADSTAYSSSKSVLDNYHASSPCFWRLLPHALVPAPSALGSSYRSFLARAILPGAAPPVNGRFLWCLWFTPPFLASWPSAITVSPLSVSSSCAFGQLPHPSAHSVGTQEDHPADRPSVYWVAPCVKPHVHSVHSGNTNVGLRRFRQFTPSQKLNFLTIKKSGHLRAFATKTFGVVFSRIAARHRSSKDTII